MAQTLLYRFPIDGAQFRASFRALMSELGDVQDMLAEVEGWRGAVAGPSAAATAGRV